jgi:hypothetical protein
MPDLKLLLFVPASTRGVFVVPEGDRDLTAFAANIGEELGRGFLAVSVPAGTPVSVRTFEVAPDA